jgi:sugar phosphate isomerase/epimerase
MRFGIMAMQIGSLIPSGLSPENAAATIGDFDHAALVGELASLGFRPIELGGDLVLFMPHTYAPPAIEQLGALKQAEGLSYTVHLPLWSVEPSTPLTPVREGSVRALVDCIQATKSLQPEAYVLHATGALAAEFYRMRLPETARALLLRQFQAGAAESIRAILSETGIPSRQLAIETIEFPFELTMELAEMLDLSLCLDIGHVLAGFCGPVELFDALEQMLPRLVEIHLHDAPWQGEEQVIGYGTDHRALGKGDLDVGRLLDRLEEVGFDGPIIFELTVGEALESLDAIRRIRLRVVDED